MRTNTSDWGSCQYETAAETYHKLFSGELNEKDIVLNSERIREPELDDLRKELKENAEDVLDPDDFKEMRERITYAKTPEDFFNITRDLAWDLWSAISIISYFVDFVLKVQLEEDDDNFEVGVVCYLLTKYYDTNENTFKDFST
jgi:hypothetical protein